MAEILEVVTTVFVGLILSAGVILIAVVALAGVGLLRRELGLAFAWPGGTRPQRFYERMPRGQINQYQGYIDRAFELSPALEFDRDDPRLGGLVSEAIHNDSLNEIYLRMMIIQYVEADRHVRERYRHNWVKKVIGRKETDFFPDPWSIISACIKER